MGYLMCWFHESENEDNLIRGKKDLLKNENRADLARDMWLISHIGFFYSEWWFYANWLASKSRPHKGQQSYSLKF